MTPSGKSWLDAYRVSIHTPTKGVTKNKVVYVPPVYVSIHTPTKGVTKSDYALNLTSFVSIHTPTKGVTAYSANS